MFRKTSPICQCYLHSLKKCWKVHIRVLALLIPPWIVNSKKIQKNSKKIWWQSMTNVLSACQVSLGNDIHGSRGKIIIYFGVLIVFLPWLPQMSFPDGTWQALKTIVILWHQIFWIFLNILRLYCSWWCDKS